MNVYGINKDLYLFECNNLAYIDYENRILINSLKKLNRNVENSFNETITALENKIRNDAHYISFTDEKDLQSSYLNQVYDFEIETIKNLNRQQRYAIILIVFSFFESRLDFISKVVRMKSKKTIPTKIDYIKMKIPVNDLTVYWKYLSETLNDTLSDCNEAFEFINSQKFVRDKIAHKNGVFRKKDEKDDYKFIKTIYTNNTKFDNECRIDILNGNYVNLLLLKTDELLYILLVIIERNIINSNF